MGVYNGSATGPELDAAASFVKDLGQILIKGAAGRYQNGTCCYIGQFTGLYQGIRVMCIGNKHSDATVVKTGQNAYALYGSPETVKFYVTTADSKIYIVVPSGTSAVPLAITNSGAAVLSCSGATLPSGATEITVT